MNYLRPQPRERAEPIRDDNCSNLPLYSRALATCVASIPTRPPASLATERIIRYVSVQNRPTVRSVFYEIRWLGAIPAIGVPWTRRSPH